MNLMDQVRYDFTCSVYVFIFIEFIPQDMYFIVSRNVILS